MNTNSAALRNVRAVFTHQPRRQASPAMRYLVALAFALLSFSACTPEEQPAPSAEVEYSLVPGPEGSPFPFVEGIARHSADAPQTLRATFFVITQGGEEHQYPVRIDAVGVGEARRFREPVTWFSAEVAGITLDTVRMEDALPHPPATTIAPPESQRDTPSP